MNLPVAPAPADLAAGALFRTPAEVMMILVLASFLGVLWTVTVERVRHEHRLSVETEFKQNSNIVLALEEQTVRTLKGIDQRLTFIKDNLERYGASAVVRDLVRDVESDDELVVSLAIMDDQGVRILGSAGKDPISVADREYFTSHLAAPNKNLFVGKPAMGRVNGRWVIHMSRRIDNPDGTFGGVVMASVNPDYFTNLYGTVDIGNEGLITLVGLDGIARARRSGAIHTYGGDRSAGALLAKQRASPSGTYESTGIVDGVPRFIAYRTLVRYPLLVAVGTSQALVLAPFYARRWYYYTATGVISVVAVLLAIAFAALRRRERRSLAQLAVSEDRYRGIFEGALEGIFQTTPAGRFIAANQAMARIVGYSSAESLIAERVDIGAQGYAEPGCREEFMRLMERDGSVTGFEYELVRRDGSRVWVSEAARAVRDSLGAVKYYEGFLEDVTERKFARDKLRQSEALLQAVGRTARVGGWSLDIAKGRVTWSDEVCKIHGMPAGYSPTLEEALQFYAPSSRERIVAACKACIEDGTGYDEELEIVTSGGARVWIRAVGEAIRDARGKTTVMEGAFQDISVKKDFEEELRRGANRLAITLESITDGFFTLDRDGNCLYINQEAERLLQTSRAKVIGTSWWSLFPDGFGTSLHAQCLTALAEVRRVNFEAFFTPPGKWLEVNIYPSEDGLAIYFRDLTERRLAEQSRESLEAQLRESQKMEAIGRLAGGVAHDFNNILGAILGNVELASEDVANFPRAMECMDEIRKAGHRARSLVQQILSFSRRQPIERRSMALAPILQESARLLVASLPARIAIDVRCAADTPPILADATQIQQVLLNLVTNASHAIGRRTGRIGIGCDRVVVGDAPPIAGLQPGPHARISVTDDGSGMDKETVRRMFEPFFTTKPVGEGTGLGLSVVHGIVQNHDGAVCVKSEPGKGTTFELYFPAALVTAEEAQPNVPAPRVIGSGQRIMYVDDDEALGFLVMRMLGRRGFDVRTFSDQNEALDSLRADRFGYDLVVTDYNMPGMSGVDVALACREIAPQVPVAIASGYITDDMRRDALAAGVRELIFKPDVVEEFLDVVERLLSADLVAAAD